MWVEGDVCKKANSSVTRAGSQYLTVPNTVRKVEVSGERRSTVGVRRGRRGQAVRGAGHKRTGRVDIRKREQDVWRGRGPEGKRRQQGVRRRRTRSHAHVPMAWRSRRG